jgi:hypothetical protein
MAREKTLSMQKHTLNLREGDYEKMAELFPDLGGGPAIRQLVSKFVDRHLKPDQE